MPRKAKCRRVCGEPVCRRFFPQSTPGGTAREPVTLSVEELESLRLCDYEGLEQGEAAERMEVSRGTFQRILYSARKKTAQALVTGAELAIGGGQYIVRDGGCPHGRGCGARGVRCYRVGPLPAGTGEASGGPVSSVDKTNTNR